MCCNNINIKIFLDLLNYLFLSKFITIYYFLSARVRDMF